MNVAPAFVAEFRQRIALCDQSVSPRFAPVGVECVRHCQDCIRRRVRVVGCQCDVAFVAIERADSRLKGGTAVGVVVHKICHRLAQRRPRQFRFTFVGQAFRVGQCAVHDLPQIGLGPAAGYLLLIDTDCDSDGLLRALQIQVRIGRNTRRHFGDKSLGYRTLRRLLNAKLRRQQFKNAGQNNMLRQNVYIRKCAVGKALHCRQPPEMGRLRRPRRVRRLIPRAARGERFGFRR